MLARRAASVAALASLAALAALASLAGCSARQSSVSATKCAPCSRTASAPSSSASPSASSARTQARRCPTPPKRRHGLLVGDPQREGIDKAKLAAMIKQAEDEHSSALLILKNGKLVYERYWGVEPSDALVAMSVAKSFVSLAIGKLIEEGKIKRLTQRVQELVPELKGKPAGRARLIELLNHTSGLSPRRTKRKTGKLLEHAEKTPLYSRPGLRFRYNNNAVDLLGLVIRRASEMFLDNYLQSRLFVHVGAVGNYWLKYVDGHVRAAGELMIRPVDLAKVGQMLLDGGKAGGKQVVPAAWIKRSIAPSQPIYPPCGMLWWRHAEFRPVLTKRELRTWRVSGVRAATRKAARALLDKQHADRETYLTALKKTLGDKRYKRLRKRAKRYGLPLYNVHQRGPLLAYAARGWLGQHLVVVPSTRLVAVRMRLPTKADYKRRGPQQDNYAEFPKHAIALAKK